MDRSLSQLGPLWVGFFYKSAVPRTLDYLGDPRKGPSRTLDVEISE